MLASDNELLGLYVHAQDEASFERLIRRHSPMVMGVCRSLLWQTQDAEDAFQAVFILLALKAPKLLNHNSVGGWLHETSVRTSLRLRKKISRTREVKMEHEPFRSGVEPWQVIADSRALELLHKEIKRLPKRYREVVVLCHLEGKSRSQCASILDCTTASVKAALARGRKLLRQRLLKHGIAASAALTISTVGETLMASASSVTEESAVSEALIQSTIQSCSNTASGSGFASLPSIIQTLIQREFFTMNLASMSGIGIASTILIACGLTFSASAVSNHETISRHTLNISPVANVSQNFRSFNLSSTNDQDSGGESSPSSDKNDTAKKATETWQQYVDRLHEMKLITQAEKDEWEAGMDLEVTRNFSVTQVRQENRIRQVPVKRFRVENHDGENVQVPYTEIVNQNYKVAVPYIQSHTATLKLPAKGDQPEDAKHPGFLQQDGTRLPDSIARTATAVAKPSMTAQPLIQEFKQTVEESAKQSDETWKTYIDRLAEFKWITPEQKALWEAGNEITLSKDFSATTIRPQTRNRVVPVTRLLTETDKDGKVVSRPVVENVTQTYTVMVPEVITKAGTLKIPGADTAEDSETNKGFLDSSGAPLVISGSQQIAIKTPQTAPTERSTKLTTETWKQYVDRLVFEGLISENQGKQWANGSSIQVEAQFTTTSFQERTRIVNTMESVTKTVRDSEGVERQVTTQKPIPKEQTVRLPVSSVHAGVLKIPAPGEKPEDAENPGFIGRNGKPIPSSEKAPVQPVAPTKSPETLSERIEIIKQKSIKKTDETWEAFVQRLHRDQLISDNQLEKWKSGKGVKVLHSISGSEYRQETRTRTVPVVKLRTETRDGKKVQVRFTENVPQTYTVMIPTFTAREGVFAIPARGKEAENATTDGMILRALKETPNEKEN